MSEIFQTILYQPFFNLLIGLYNVIPGHDIGIVIILLTVLIRLALYPLMSTSIKAQKSLQDLQPKLAELKKKHGKDKQALAQDTMKLYKEHKVNPMSSCFPLLIQLPILLALFWVLRDVLGDVEFSKLYSFVNNPGQINPMMFGFVNLAVPNMVLAVLAGAAQFWQAKMLQTKRPPQSAGSGAKDEDMAAIMNKQMTYFMPVITVLIGIKMSGGLMVYWFVSTLLTALQQLVIFRKNKEA